MYRASFVLLCALRPGRGAVQAGPSTADVPAVLAAGAGQLGPPVRKFAQGCMWEMARSHTIHVGSIRTCLPMACMTLHGRTQPPSLSSSAWCVPATASGLPSVPGNAGGTPSHRRAQQCCDALRLAGLLALKEPALTTPLMRSQLSRLSGQLAALQVHGAGGMVPAYLDAQPCADAWFPLISLR